MTRDQILNEGFDAGDLAFTARDVYSLYKAMKKHYGDSEMKDVKPSKCVFPKKESVRVTMKHVTDYEKILKQRMTELAAKMPNETGTCMMLFEKEKKTKKTKKRKKRKKRKKMSSQ